MSVLQWVLGAAALVGLGVSAAFVWSVVKAVRRAAVRTRRVVQPMRVRGLVVRGVLSPSAAARRDLAQDVLQARRAYDLARRNGRPVRELDPAVQGLEKVARSLDVDLRMGRAVDAELARTREAARALTEACRPDPTRSGLLDDVADAAERARLVAEVQRELTGGSSAPPARRGRRWPARG